MNLGRVLLLQWQIILLRAQALRNSMNAERFVNGEREQTVKAERKTVNDERTMSARWTHGERTVSEQWTNAKMGK